MALIISCFLFSLHRPVAGGLYVSNVSGSNSSGHFLFLEMAVVPILAQDREKQVVLPFPFNAQVLPGVTLLPEPGSDKQRTAGCVGGQASCLDPMEAKSLEGKGEDKRKRRSHVALLREGFADPIAEIGRLGHATAQIGQADSAN
jgi:hypothetical protein